MNSPLSLSLFLHLLLFLLSMSFSTTIPRPLPDNSIEILLHAWPTTETIPLRSSHSDTKSPAKKVPIHLTGEAIKKRFRTAAVSTAEQNTKSMSKTVLQRDKSSRPAGIHAAVMYRHNPAPNYPALARRRNWQGTVVLAVVVTVEGKGKSVRIHRSSGYTILDKSALHSVRSWRFQPGTEAGKAIEMEVLLPVHFRLDD